MSGLEKSWGQICDMRRHLVQQVWRVCVGGGDMEQAEEQN